MIIFTDVKANLIYQYNSTSIYKHTHILENFIRFNAKTHCNCNEPTESSNPVSGIFTHHKQRDWPMECYSQLFMV